MWELDCEESWALKNWCFELWCWRRPFRVPWTARRSNQSILKEICPGCSLEGLLLKLKLQYFGHLMQRVDSLEKTLMLGGIGGRRRKGQQRMRWLDGITDSMDMSLNSRSWWWTGRPGILWFMGLQRVGHDWATELNWTELNSDQCELIPHCSFDFHFPNEWCWASFHVFISHLLYSIEYWTEFCVLHNRDLFIHSTCNHNPLPLGNHKSGHYIHKSVSVS